MYNNKIKKFKSAVQESITDKKKHLLHHEPANIYNNCISKSQNTKVLTRAVKVLISVHIVSAAYNDEVLVLKAVQNRKMSFLKSRVEYSWYYNNLELLNAIHIPGVFIGYCFLHAQITSGFPAVGEGNTPPTVVSCRIRDVAPVA